MSKVGSWILGMQEDACWMTKEQFIKEHGVTQVDIWEKIQSSEDENWESDYEPEVYETVS
jgi:hypothetical protein